MILQTIGSASGAISTKSKLAACAELSASEIDTIPTCCPSAPIRRTSFASICSLIVAFFERPLALSRLLMADLSSSN